MAAPLVSVIMPTFDRLEFLPAALASVCAQTYPHWELIVADDGSGESTRAYLRELSTHRTRVVWLEHSGRPGVARNAAARIAVGDYLAFLDSDDLWTPEKLARQLASLRQHPERRWSYTSFTVIDAAGRTASAQRPHQQAVAGAVLERLLTDATVVALPSVMVQRELFAQLGGFDETLTMCEDDELWFRLAEQGDADACTEPLTQVRRHRHHGGDDVTAWRDRRRVLEAFLRRGADGRCMQLLRNLRAQAAAGLACSQTRSGDPRAGVLTLAASVAYGWRHRLWWYGVLRCARSMFLPAGVA
jgi:glycosyltransferase involved in cell wall biosynthesis